jgi:YD repeat-containing protein
MVTRVVSGTTTSLAYDAENRLVQHRQGTTVLASYTYDGDGTLVAKVAGGETTMYVGPHYEKNLTTGVLTRRDLWTTD